MESGAEGQHAFHGPSRPTGLSRFLNLVKMVTKASSEWETKPEKGILRVPVQVKWSQYAYVCTCVCVRVCLCVHVYV